MSGDFIPSGLVTKIGFTTSKRVLNFRPHHCKSSNKIRIELTGARARLSVDRYYQMSDPNIY